MLIRTGILCVPELDEAALQAVRTVLHQSQAFVQVVLESSAKSQRHWVEEVLRRWCDEEELDLVLTVGGTLPAPGPSAHEIVPEATLAVLDRLLPGLPEEMRACAREQTPLALLDRGVAGIRGHSLIVNLPGGANAVAFFLSAIVELLAPVLAYVQHASDAAQLNTALAGGSEAREEASDEMPPSLSASSAPATSGKLQSAEFAAFLKRALEQ